VDFDYSPEEEIFRSELREWLQHNRPSFTDGGHIRDPDEQWRAGCAWDRTLYEGGYTSGANWPTEYGGRGATLIQELIIYQEMARARAPGEIGRNARQILGPTLIRYGTDEQKAYFLPRTLSGDIRWCQGFSEPEAGSDLAGLRTRATVDGDHLVISGQKIWTSLAHRADWIFMLVRTDPNVEKHRGISFILADMTSPGITVRPFRTCVGEEDFCEVFFDEVRVPLSNVVGELNAGWRITTTALSHERATMALSRYLIHQLEVAEFADLINACEDQVSPARTEQADEALGRLLVAIEQSRLTGYWNVSKLLHGEDMGSKGSVLKVHFSQLTQALSDAAMDLLEMSALTEVSSSGIPGGKWFNGFLFSRASGIYGGTNEIQRNIIADRLVNLPR
jgi:alkylation response protein AidB-like acyl-CoA dehydrogenase